MMTLKGRKQYLCEIKFYCSTEKSKVQWQVVNSICQGFVSNIIKIPKLNIYSLLYELVLEVNPFVKASPPLQNNIENKVLHLVLLFVKL